MSAHGQAPYQLRHPRRYADPQLQADHGYRLHPAAERQGGTGPRGQRMAAGPRMEPDPHHGARQTEDEEEWHEANDPTLGPGGHAPGYPGDAPANNRYEQTQGQDPLRYAHTQPRQQCRRADVSEPTNYAQGARTAIRLRGDDADAVHQEREHAAYAPCRPATDDGLRCTAARQQALAQTPREAACDRPHHDLGMDLDLIDQLRTSAVDANERFERAVAALSMTASRHRLSQTSEGTTTSLLTSRGPAERRQQPEQGLTVGGAQHAHRGEGERRTAEPREASQAAAEDRESGLKEGGPNEEAPPNHFAGALTSLPRPCRRPPTPEEPSSGYGGPLRPEATQRVAPRHATYQLKESEL